MLVPNYANGDKQVMGNMHANSYGVLWMFTVYYGVGQISTAKLAVPISIFEEEKPDTFDNLAIWENKPARQQDTLRSKL